MREARSLAAAIAFLTTLPVGRLAALDGGDVRRAGAWFPLVGAGIGALVGVAAWGLAHALPDAAAAAAAVAVYAVLTGALHLDALADVADALGGRSRTQALEIMRDHAIGSYGATALGLDLILRTVLVAALLPEAYAIAALAVAGALARAGAVAVGAALPYARAGEGLGRPLAEGPDVRAAVAVLLGLAVAGAVARVAGLEAAAVCLCVAAACYALWRRWLGGVTGDTLGATAELGELAALAVLVAAR